MDYAKVEIKVLTKASRKVFLVGSIPALGAWQPEKAVELAYCEKCDAFITTLSLPLGEVIEFKLLAARDWDSVEKGMYYEEIQNHIITPTKGLIVDIEVARFSKK